MRALLLLLLVCGLASASFYDAFDRAVQDVARDFAVGMSQGPPLKRALGLEHEDGLDLVEYSLKNEIANNLQRSLLECLGKIKERIENGKAVGVDLMARLAFTLREFKKFNVNVGERAKEIIRGMLGKLSDKVTDILKKFDLAKRSIKDQLDDVVKDLGIRGLFERVRDLINNKLNLDDIKAYLRGVLRNSELVKTCEKIIDYLGLKGVKEVVNRVLGAVGSRNKRSAVELWKNIVELFKEKQELLKEKSKDFVEWVVQSLNKGWEHAKTKAELIKEMAKKFLEESKTTKQQLQEQALKFFREYKDILGAEWEKIKKKITGVEAE